MLGPNPLRNPEKFDKIVVAGRANPGLFKLLDKGGRPYKWDIKDVAGAQGAIETYRGWRIEQGIKLGFFFWEAEQIDEYYRDFDPLLSYDARKFFPKPVEAYHPVLAYNQIDKLIIIYKGPLRDAGGQLWSVEVEAAEYRKPPRLNVTTTPDEPQTREPSVKDRLDAEIKKELEQFNRPLPRRR